MSETALRDTWLMFRREHRCSVDRMICDPALRAEFLAAARLATGLDDEQQILWALMTLRKKKTLPSAATD